MSVNPGSEGTRDARKGSNAQEARIIDALKQNGAFQPQAWNRLDRDQQLTALQGAENTIAGIQGRGPLPVRVREGMGEGESGTSPWKPAHGRTGQNRGWHIRR